MNDNFSGENRIRILYVLANLNVGGAETHVARLVTALDSKLIIPEIFTIINKGTLTHKVESSGVRVRGPKVEENWSNIGKLRKIKCLISGAWRLYKILRKEKPDIVHYYLPMPYLIGGLVSIAARIPIRVMSRRSLNFYQKKHKAASKVERWLHRYMTRILGNSEAVLDDLRNEGVPSEKLGMIYNGVALYPNPAKSTDLLKNRLGLSDSTLVMTIIANLIPYKGHSDLIAALSIIREKIPEPWVLLCVGEDSRNIKLILEEQVSLCGLENNVVFLGCRHDVPEILALSDMAILCSHEEGFSNAVLEGMSAGLASVVTDVGGNAEAVRHNIDGVVVPARSIEELSLAIIQLALDRNLRDTMGCTARERIRDSFSIEECTRKYQQLYQSLMTHDH